MKVKLTVKQRIDLQSILPPQGDFLTLKMVRVLREELSFTQEEHEKLELKSQGNGTIEWKASAAEECTKEVSIPETIVKIIKETLERLNEAKQLSEYHLDLYEMFVGG